MEKKNVYNKYFDEKKWENVNRYNKQMLEDFLLEMKSNRRSEGTIKQYKNNLRILFLFIYDELDNVPIHKLKKKHFRNYSIYLQDKGLSTRRVNSMLSAMRSMLTFAEEDDDYEDDIKVNYAAKVKGLRNEDVREIVFLTMEEVDILRNYFIKNKMYKDALLISVLIDTGGRKNEVNQIERSSVTKDGMRTNLVTGKRNKKFRLIYNRYTKEMIGPYNKQRGKDDIKSLWIREDGSRAMDEDDIYYQVCSWRKILEELTGEFKKFNVHSFRHTCAELLNTGEHYICKDLGGKKFELNTIRLLLNHESVETTSGYLKDRGEEELIGDLTTAVEE